MTNDFQVKDRFWSYYQNLVSDEMLPYQYRVLDDSLEDEDIEKSHSFENFRIAAGESKGEFYGFVFQDSDTAKWLEAVAYSLMIKPDKELERKADEIIDLVGRVQQEDGYLDTYFIVKEPKMRWKNLRDWHELYCAGHFIEAGVAYYEATGKDKLLQIVKRLADLICSIFGPDKREGYPGHPEAELALVRLYRLTGEKRYLELAKYFIDARGVNPDFFEEDKARQGLERTKDTDWAKYYQSRLPVREEQDAVGHAVRAVYLYTGMAMTARETGDETLLAACRRMWKSIVNKRMYITGGIGSSAPAGEAFTLDYDLPGDTAYCETCASVGLIFFAKEMLQLENRAEYADVMELALYNTVLAGIQRDGKRFFYTNPLEVDPMYVKRIPELQHVYGRRPKWHSCACCPPNAARLLVSLNRYTWHAAEGTYYSDLFVGGEYRPIEDVCITTRTDYPYDGEITYEVRCGGQITLGLRNPSWCKGMEVFINGERVFGSGEDSANLLRGGYVMLEGIGDGSRVQVKMDITPRKVYANQKVHGNNGKCAFMAGPVVYCFEDADNGDINLFYADRRGESKAEALSDEIMGDVNVLKVPALRLQQSEKLYFFDAPKEEQAVLTAVPYYAWANREEGKMKVWIAER